MGDGAGDPFVVTMTGFRPADARPPEARGFHSLRVLSVIRETLDAVTIMLEVPPDMRERFRYRAGQFVTVRAVVAGETHLRSYSMSSSPEVDENLWVTVKRIAGGAVSNWLNDQVGVGDALDVNAPGGSFVLDHSDRDVVAFAAGSGITPIFSIVKSTVATTSRRVWLFYANRDLDSVIFAGQLAQLAADHPDRLHVEHFIDAERGGFVGGGVVSEFVGTNMGANFFVCGPKPFMDTVVGTLVWSGARQEQLHVELFTPEDEAPLGEVAPDVTVIATLGTKTVTTNYQSRSTLLQTARAAGLRAPSSCQSGDCATCMARVIEGTVEMRKNAVLSPEEVEEGWVLTCQAVPLSPLVRVVYE